MRIGRLGAWYAIAVGIGYLVLVGGTWYGIYLAPLRVITMLIAGVMLAGWAVAARRAVSWRPQSRLTVPIGVALGSLAISTAFSRSPRISLEYLGYAVILAALYLLLARLLAEPFFRRRIEVLAGVLFVLIAVLYIGLVAAHWIHWWALVGRLTVPPLRPEFEGLTYGNPSAVLTIVALFATSTAASVMSNVARARAAGILILAAVGIVAVMSGSRAGWLALAATAVLVAAVVLVSPTNRSVIRELASPITGRRAGRLGLALGAVGLAIAAAVLTPAVAQRTGAGGEDLRTQFAVVATRLFEASPIVGTGPGTWVIERAGVTLSPETDYYIPHAHNLEVETLAELGVVGAAAGLFLGWHILKLIRSGASDPDAARRRWAWAAGIGLLYFLLHQVLDFYMNLPAVLFAAVLPIAYLDATSRSSAAVERRASRVSARLSRIAPLATIAPVAFGVTVAIAVAGLLLQEVPALQLAAAVTAANSGDWASADPLARAAATADPEIASYDMAAGLTAAHAGDHAAAASWFMAVVTRTDFPEAWLDLAAEQVVLGQTGNGVTSLKRALRLGWERPAVAMPGGDLALRLGLRSDAIDAFANAIAAVPSLAADPWWVAEPARLDVLPEAIDAAIARATPDRQWEIALMAGDTARAMTVASQLPNASAGLERIAAWSGDPDAAGRVFGACRAHPLDVGGLFWCARLSSHLGDQDQATTFRQIAFAESSDAFPDGAELRVNEGASTGRIEGHPASLWGTFTYRRTTPLDLLVPELLHLYVE